MDATTWATRGDEGGRRLIAFLDECGDHSVSPVDAAFPILVLAVVFGDADAYRRDVLAGLNALKMRFWSHEGVVLHSREIRKQVGEFAFLHDQATRAAFGEAVAGYFRSTSFHVAVVCHRKIAPAFPGNPYHQCLGRALEVLRRHAGARGFASIRLVVEARGGREDARLRRWFDEFVACWPSQVGCALEIRRKRDNIAGLQVADLCAYPAARHALGGKGRNDAFGLVAAHLVAWLENTRDGLAEARPSLRPSHPSPESIMKGPSTP